MKKKNKNVIKNLLSSMNKDTEKIHGKTIKDIHLRAINVWDINFTDGTHVELWAENDGPMGIGQLWLSDEL